jgi:hypothetical protein
MWVEKETTIYLVQYFITEDMWVDTDIKHLTLDEVYFAIQSKDLDGIKYRVVKRTTTVSEIVID